MPRTETINIIVQTKGAEKDIKKLGKGLDETKKQGKATGVGISGIFSAVSSGVTRAIPALNAFKTSLISTGVGALVVAVGGLVTLMSKSLGKATEFSKAMSSVGAVSGASAEELAALSKSAKELGSTTAFTAVQVAELQTEFAKLGFNTQEIIDASEATLGLAASLDVGLADAATLAGSTLRSFGLDTKETQRVVDVMAASASSSALDFSSLTESLKLVAPTSRAVGLTIEQTTAMLGALANSGLKGSIAGTGLSKTFIELNKKGLTLEQAFTKINSSSNKLNTAIDLVGVVGAKSLQTLANSADDIEELNKILDESGEAFGGIGAAAGIAQKRLDNLAGDITKLDSAWEGFLLSIEDGEGAISQLSRGAIQLLTVGISKLQVISREFGYYWDGLMMTLNKSIANTSKTWDGFFGQIESAAGFYAAKIKMSLADVPLLGRGIDKKAAEEDLAYYAKFLDYYVKVSKEASEQVNNFQTNVSIARFKGEAEVAEAKKAREALVAEQQITEQEITDEAKDAEKKRLEEVAKLREKFKKAQEDLNAKDAEQKLALQRKRAIEEINQSVANAEEKKQLILAVNALYDQKEFELAKETEEKKAEAIKAIQDANIEKSPLEKLEAEKTQALLSLDLLKATNEERASVIAAFDKKIQDQKDKEAAIELQREKEIQQQKLLVISDTFGAIAGILGENSRAGKAAAIAQATINTYQGITEVLTNKTTLPEPFGTIQKIASAGTILASGLKAVGSIKSQKLPSISGGRGGGSGVSASAAPALAAPSFNIVGQSGTNQLAESIGSQEKQPIKAYVVSSDVTSAQSMERNIVSGASI